MKLTHPTINAISIGGNEYCPIDGVFDLPESAVAIAMTCFGFTEANSGRAKRAKASGSPSSKAKPRSRKPKAKAEAKAKAKPQGEEMKGGMSLVVTSSYSLTPTFSFSGPGFGGLVHPVPGHNTSYKLQGTSCKMKSVAASDFASGIYRIGDLRASVPTAFIPSRVRLNATWYNSIARYDFPTGPSPGASLSPSRSPPGRLVGLVPGCGALASYKLGGCSVPARWRSPCLFKPPRCCWHLRLHCSLKRSLH